jgi:Fur family peroxide stress response transcriptional regulator
MIDPKIRLNEMITKLKEGDYRITPQRLAVLKILAESVEHPSAEEIYGRVKKDFPTTSLATVYKTLTVMKDVGELLEIGFSDGRTRYDGNNPHPHPHLVCTMCRKIIDTGSEALSHMTESLAEETGFRIIGHRLDFFGICPECQGKGN